MAIEKITATVAAKPVQRNTSHTPRLPVQGDTLQAALDKVEGEDLLVTADGGLPLRLAGMARLLNELAPGDMLLMRVLTTSPRLTFSLINTLPRDPAGNGAAGTGANFASESSSMRTDQLALRQIAWPRPAPESLATAWRTQVLAGIEQKTLQPAAGLPLSLLAAIDHQARLPGDTAAMPGSSDRWLFPAFGWGGSPVLLRLIDADPDQPRVPRKQRAVALRLEFDLPGFGRASAQIRIIGLEVDLELAVNENAVQMVRNSVPALASALARIGLRIHRWRVTLSGKNDTALPAWSASDMLLVRQALSSTLFRAGAEVMLALIEAASAYKTAVSNRAP